MISKNLGNLLIACGQLCVSKYHLQLHVVFEVERLVQLTSGDLEVDVLKAIIITI